MQCSVCRYELPAGTAFCPNCGSPVSTMGSSPNQGLPPTMLASSPNQGIDPTVMASPTPPPASYPPSTGYGESAPPPPPSGPYGTPSYETPYSAPQQAPYGAPPQPAYGAPAYVPPQPYMQPQPKKRNGCVTALIITLVVVVLIIGGSIAASVYFFNKTVSTVSTAIPNFQATATTIDATANSILTPTTNTSSSGGAPTAGQIDPTAASNITSAQTASGIDSNYKPTNQKTSFNVGDTVYITYTAAGNAGYTMAKIYRDGQFDIQSDSPTTVHSGDTNGYFNLTVNNPGQFVVGIYWCTQSSCSDAALAQVVNFTVS